MIDLRFPLPTSIEVDGELYELDTDFRVWIEFLREAEEDGFVSADVFVGRRPAGDWVKAAMEFAECATVTPKKRAQGGTETLDLIRDGDYLVGSFWQVYGIDLTTASLHWHVFLALLRSLPEGCKLTEIMGYRGFRESDLKRQPKAVYKELRDLWKLPPKVDQRLLEWQERMFESANGKSQP